MKKQKLLFLFGMMFAIIMVSSSCSCHSPYQKSTTSLMTVITEAPVPPSIPSDRFYLEFDGIPIIPGDEYPALFLPAEDSSYTVPSASGDGSNRVYCFEGVEITTFSDEMMTQYVLSIYIMDDRIHTPESVSIGDSVDQVLAAYGKQENDQSGVLLYRKNGTVLEIITVNGSVTSIEYRIDE